VATSALNELTTYAKKFGGIYARKALVTTYSIADTVLERAKGIDINVFTLEDIKNPDFGDRLGEKLSR
jgi:hypothetical protein